jgi:tripartite-type tricarboxylate transporter receptor subunit TctC
MPGYEAKTWNGFIAPTKTPTDIVERLSREIRAIVQEKDVTAQFAAVGATTMPLDPEEFGALLRRDAEKWATLAKSRGIHAD